MRFQVLTAANMKTTTIFWLYAGYNLVEINQHFRDVYFLHHEANDQAPGEKVCCDTEAGWKR